MPSATPETDLLRIDDQLTPDERLVRDTVRQFTADRIEPHIADWFEAGAIPRDLMPELGKLGLLGMHLTGYGCAGMGAVAYGVACRELEAADSGLRSMVSVQGSLAMFPIWKYGSGEQKEEWLPKMATGEAVGCFGLTEPDHGSDPSGMSTRARRDGSDWVLSGAKMWITNGSIADIAIIWAATTDGMRGFLVDTRLPGFEATEIENKLSLRASNTAALFMNDVVVPADAQLPEAAGLKAPLSCLNQARYGITWGVIGAAQDCLHTVIEYTKSREMFGRPLAATQGVQIRLADMARRITGAQLLSLQLGRLKDAGRLAPAQVSLAKWNNARMALDIARDCRDLLGAAGISAEFSPVRHMLNLESVVTYEGTQAIHQLAVGRELTGISAF
jgi:glutaryl-CoA dehydrogenase